MRKIELCGKAVELYDSIEDLPVRRFHKYNKMVLLDAGLGSNISDFDRHAERLTRYVYTGKADEARRELDNMRMGVYLVQSEVSPRYMSFAVLVKSIDGEPCEDLSDDGLRRVVDMCANIPNSIMTAQMEAVKKKIDDELRMYFPKLFDDADVKEYYDMCKRRTEAMLRGITEDGQDTDKAVDDMTAEMLTFFRPLSFSGADNMEIKHDRHFENMCVVISGQLHVDAKQFTVLEFYNAFEYILNQQKKLKRKK